MRVKLLEPIEGFEDVAEWRPPQQGEYFFSGAENKATVASFSFKRDFQLVLTPIKRWRPATVEDLLPIQNGEKVKARFRDSSDQEWVVSELTGYIKDSTHPWYKIGVIGYSFCEVLDA